MSGITAGGTIFMFVFFGISNDVDHTCLRQQSIKFRKNKNKGNYSVFAFYANARRKKIEWQVQGFLR